MGSILESAHLFIVNELTQFENDARKMVKDIEFRKISNNFQNKLKSDIKK